MAVSVSVYNQTTKLLADSSLTLTTLKLTLHTGYTFDATHTASSDYSGTEVSGNGWTSGGETLASVAVSTVTTNDAKLAASDVSKTASGGSIGPADSAILRDSTADKLLAYIDFGGDQEAGVGTDFKVTWNANGIFTFSI
jgi:hypothetical protein